MKIEDQNNTSLDCQLDRH